MGECRRENSFGRSDSDSSPRESIVARRAAFNGALLVSFFFSVFVIYVLLALISFFFFFLFFDSPASFDLVLAVCGGAVGFLASRRVEEKSRDDEESRFEPADMSGGASIDR